MREETVKGNADSSCMDTVLKHKTYQKRGTVTLVSNETKATEFFSVENRFLLILRMYLNFGSLVLYIYIYIHTHTHTHTHIYIYVCVCVCVFIFC
jgi:hypothetical protein